MTNLIELFLEEQKVWPKSRPSHFFKEAEVGYETITFTIPTVGRRFVRGRTVYCFLDRTELGEEYFYPKGRYGGRILK